MLNVVKLSVMLNVVMLSVMLNAVMLSVVAPLIHQLYMDIYELYLSSLLRTANFPCWIHQFPFEHNIGPPWNFSFRWHHTPCRQSTVLPASLCFNQVFETRLNQKMRLFLLFATLPKEPGQVQTLPMAFFASVNIG